MDNEEIAVLTFTGLVGIYRDDIRTFLNARLASFWAARQDEMAILHARNIDGNWKAFPDPELRQMLKTLVRLAVSVGIAYVARYQNATVVQSIAGWFSMLLILRLLVIMSILRFYELSLAVNKNSRRTSSSVV